MEGRQASRQVVIIILRMSSNPSLDKFLSSNLLISEMGSYSLICCGNRENELKIAPVGAL